MRTRFLALACLNLGGFAAATPTPAEVFLRWNQAGYRPEHPKSLVAMSTTDLRGQPWRIERNDPVASSPLVLTGAFGASTVGAGDHTPLPFNHVVDFSALTSVGRYRFVAGRDSGAAKAEFIVEPAPCARLIPEVLRHLRVMRSGSDETILRRFSHPGDAAAPVHVPDGDPAGGRWKPASPPRTVDVLGGWYDAGDQIKFTLNIAYTTYHLLLAHQLQPSLFTRVNSRSDLPDLLDEARHGLEFLMKVFPDENTFIIQVGDERDHEQGYRLPENDPLDGRRPALCALSRVHMGAAAAALALGARTFGPAGRAADAERYTRQAQAIFTRARRTDTVPTAFERGRVNDFYHDPGDADQMALAAAELSALTGERACLEQAIALAPPPGREVSWADWNWLANAALAPHDAASRARLLAETGAYGARAAGDGAPWSIPGRYVWGSLHRWIGAANATRLASRLAGPSAQGDALFHGILDYVFGRNNWGVSFLFSETLPNTLRHIYSPAYRLLGAFPTGALSEGPGDRATHDTLERFFRTAPDDPLARFNTPVGVFHDNASDFMCQEATIGGQADLVLMLTLASLEDKNAAAP